MALTNEPLLAAQAPAIQWRRYLFISHLTAAAGERMWEFSAGILLLKMSGGTSLQLPAILSFAMLMTTVFLSSKVGRFIDKSGALSTPLLALGVQNGAIAAAALSAAAALHVGDCSVWSIAAVVSFSCVASLAGVCSKISVEKHWAVVLSDGDQVALATLNGIMRRIDLSCKILAPGVAGFVMSGFGTDVGGVMIAVINIAAWPVESFCLSAVHRDQWCQERLEAKGKDLAASSPKAEGANPEYAGPGRALKLYFSQKGLWPSTLALSMIYLTVLSFDQVMTAYIVTLGVDISIISIYRGVGEVFGLAATIASPPLVKKFGPGSSGTFFIWYQLAWLIPSAVGASVWARNNLSGLASSTLLVAGVGISRFGLWGFDLSVTQLLQENCEPKSALGAVSGTQNALQSTFGAIAAGLGIFFCKPTQFSILANISWCAVASAALLHTCRQRF